MLQRLRQSGSARAFLFAAGLLAVSASFGLHPEPASDPGASGRLPSWAATAALTAASHECPACLAHRPLALARPSPIVLRPLSLVAKAAVLVVKSPDLREPRPRQNRAPPVAS